MTSRRDPRGNCFGFSTPGHFVEDGRKKDTAKCSKCGEKSHLDREVGDKEMKSNESVAIAPTLATPDDEYWAALRRWRTADMLVESACTDYTVTNIDAFLDFVSFQSVVRNPNGEASRVLGRGCVRISISSSKGEFKCELQMRNVLCEADYSSNLFSVSSGGIAIFSRKEIAA